MRIRTNTRWSPGPLYRSAYLAAALGCASLANAHPGIDQQIADVSGWIEENPGDARLYLRRGELHRIHREWKLAEADYRKARSLDRELSEVDLALGTLLLDRNDAAGALKALDRYVARRPDVPAGFASRGRARERLGEHLAAASDLSRAIDHPQNVRPQPDDYLDRARALQAAGKDHLADAVRGLDEGLSRLGPAITLQLLAIELDVERGEHARALERVETIAGGSARKETWLVRRGEILEGAGRIDEARQAYADALASIEALPTGKRRVRANQRLEAEARAALVRLTPAESGS